MTSGLSDVDKTALKNNASQAASKARKLVLPSFTLTEVCEATADNSTFVSFPKNHADTLPGYHLRPINRTNHFSKRGNTYSYNLMPVVVDGQGALWTEANLYLLSRLDAAISPNMASYHSIADDLAAFKRFLEDEDTDFRSFPARKYLRPTYHYRGSLQHAVEANECAISTARRRMGAVIGFYRWLISNHLLTPENPPWVDSDVFIKLTDSKGFQKTKAVTTTDISVRMPIQNDPYDGAIEDGGKLRPLPIEDQEIILDALVSLGNTEMTLIHLVALFTGARIQTVLTIRVKHVLAELPSEVVEHRLPIGPGTSIDSKYDKRMSLHLPRWLYEKLRIYAHSLRAKERRLKTGGDTLDQYLFISAKGAPFYTSKSDRNIFQQDANTRHAKSGQGVRQYIRDFVLPLIKQTTGKSFQYRFHDLRASFGMNLTEHQLELVATGKATLHQVREFVKTRMGHQSAGTTDLYLNFRKHQVLVTRVQISYEGRLKDLIDKASRID